MGTTALGCTAIPEQAVKNSQTLEQGRCIAAKTVQVARGGQPYPPLLALHGAIQGDRAGLKDRCQGTMPHNGATHLRHVNFTLALL